MTSTTYRPYGSLVRALGRFLWVAVILVVLGAQSASAFPEKLSASGQLDFAYGAAVASAGGEGSSAKPESKLFYTGDGVTQPVRWWAVLGTSGDATTAAGVYLWQLVDHSWVKTLQFPGADPWAKADTLLDGQLLYVSLRDDVSSTAGNPQQSLLYSVPYLGGGSWGSPSPPSVITSQGPGHLTIAKDGLGRLWTAYMAKGTIKVGYTSPGATAFSFVTVPTPAVTTDDRAAITSFGSNKIGVMWSDQNSKKDFFAWRGDGEAIGTWHIETAYGGGVGGCPTATSDLCADNHINLKTYGGDVYAAIKTSLGDPAVPTASDPMVVLLHRDASGTWSASTVSTIGVGGSRPVVVLSPSSDRLYVFARKNSSGVRVWESSFSSPSFTPEASIPWTSNGSGDVFDDATSTKQVTTEASGVVVVTSRPASDEYWHNEFLPQTAPPDFPPVAGLTLSPSSGTVPLAVTADASGSTDTDATPIATYAFDFGDGTVVGPQAGATAQHTYSAAGPYTVTVTVTDTGGLSSTATGTVNVSAHEYVGNPGFEASTSGWNNGGYTAVTLSRVAGGHSGDWSAQLVNTGTATVQCTLNDAPDWVGTTSAGTYTGSLWVRADTAGATLKLRFRERQGGTTLLQQITTATLTTSWQKVTVAITPTSPGTSSIDFTGYIPSAPQGACFSADDASITQA